MHIYMRFGLKTEEPLNERLPFLSVGVAGFEPTTSCSQSRRANRTAPHPVTFTVQI